MLDHLDQKDQKLPAIVKNVAVGTGEYKKETVEMDLIQGLEVIVTVIASSVFYEMRVWREEDVGRGRILVVRGIKRAVLERRRGGWISEVWGVSCISKDKYG